MKTYTLILLLIMCDLANSHAQVLFPHKDIVDVIDNINMRPPGRNEFDGVEGSPYLNEKFFASQVIYPNGDTIRDVAMRYNVYSDRIEYYQDNNVLILLETNPIDHIVLGYDRLVYRSPPTFSKIPGGYFVLVTGGKVSILAKHSITFQDRQPPGPMTEPRPAQLFRNPPRFFVELENGRIVKISNTNKLISLLGDHQEELKQVAKKEKISARNRDDLAKLIAYYNGLK